MARYYGGSDLGPKSFEIIKQAANAAGDELKKHELATIESVTKPKATKSPAVSVLANTGWPRHRENREFDSYFFQTGKTQGILL